MLFVSGFLSYLLGWNVHELLNFPLNEACGSWGSISKNGRSRIVIYSAAAQQIWVYIAYSVHANRISELEGDRDRELSKRRNMYTQSACILGNRAVLNRRPAKTCVVPLVLVLILIDIHRASVYKRGKLSSVRRNDIGVEIRGRVVRCL
jgi:hypothetical protein